MYDTLRAELKCAQAVTTLPQRGRPAFFFFLANNFCLGGPLEHVLDQDSAERAGIY